MDKQNAIDEMKRRARRLDEQLTSAAVKFVDTQLRGAQELRQLMIDGADLQNEIDRAAGGRGGVIFAFEAVVEWTDASALLSAVHALRGALNNAAARAARRRTA